MRYAGIVFAAGMIMASPAAAQKVESVHGAWTVLNLGKSCVAELHKPGNIFLRIHLDFNLNEIRIVIDNPKTAPASQYATVSVDDDFGNLRTAEIVRLNGRDMTSVLLPQYSRDPMVHMSRNAAWLREASRIQIDKAVIGQVRQETLAFIDSNANFDRAVEQTYACSLRSKKGR